LFISPEYRRYVWDSALSWLAERADMDIVRQHMSVPSSSYAETKADLYIGLLESLKNRQGMPNAIGDVQRLGDCLFGFDPSLVVEHFGDDWGALLDLVREDVQPTSKMDKNNRKNSWVIFCKGATCGAKFLSKFDDVDEFLGYVSDFDAKPTTRPALPLLLGEELFGFGFSLACDFLMELGFTNFSKPDVHLLELFSGLSLAEENPLDVFRAVAQMAEEVKETPFAVDKVFWLIGSGKLYLTDDKFKTSKPEFIERLKSGWREKHPD
jgi:hypothetical protein